MGFFFFPFGAEGCSLERYSKRGKKTNITKLALFVFSAMCGIMFPRIYTRTECASDLKSTRESVCNFS